MCVERMGACGTIRVLAVANVGNENAEETTSGKLRVRRRKEDNLTIGDETRGNVLDENVEPHAVLLQLHSRHRRRLTVQPSSQEAQ